MPHFLRFFPLGAPVLALAFFLNGCGGEHSRDIEAAPPVGPNGKPLPVLKAKDAFFDGKLFVEVTLSRGRGKGGYKPAPIPGMPSEDDSSEDADKKITPELIDALQHRRTESPLPPVVLWLRLSSAAADPLKVEIAEFKSDLGNFAVQPDHFTLAPGQSADPDAMISRLGMTSTEIPVTVSLRINGKKETRVLTLLPVADDASQPPAP